ncbi:MAG: M23 family metallopeptidase [Clostridia bacterium]|nr:M23 family metallopeptidase [Clostridia bacterium]
MNNRFYKIGTCIGIAIIIAIIACIVVANKKDNKIAKEEQSLIMSSANILENESSESTDTESEGFNVIEESNNITGRDDEDKKVEVTKKSNENDELESKNKVAKNSEKTNNKSEATEKKQEEVKDPTFKYPVKGECIQDYAKDQLVYSATLGEWITHTGIDIKANKTTVVMAAADGQVKSIKNDPRYGLTVVIEHSNGFNTVYSNLLTAEFVSIGENVKSGQTIGTVGNTAAFEILDEPHLHFEILKNGEAVDPNMYLKN